MADLGYISLLLALIVAIYGIVVSIYGALRSNGALMISGRNALYVVAGFITIATVIVITILLRWFPGPSLDRLIITGLISVALFLGLFVLVGIDQEDRDMIAFFKTRISQRIESHRG